VINVCTKDGFALSTLKGGACIRSRYAVVCTGGLFMDENLTGILTSCYSYLVSIKEPENK
jgi:hypothetical protein